MARIIETHVTPRILLDINTYLENGDIVRKTFEKDDIFYDEPLRYAEDGDIKVAKGRLRKINYTINSAKRNYDKITTAKSYFAEDVVLDSIEVDSSQEFISNIITVPGREILEFSNETPVKRVKPVLRYSAYLIVELSDESENRFYIEEGAVYKKFTFLDLLNGVDRTVEARVLAITYDENLTPESVVFVADGIEFVKININQIKYAGDAVSPVVTVASKINELIEASDNNGIINLDAGTVVNDISITKDVVLMGATPDIPMNAASNKGKTTDTIISGKVAVKEGCSVTMKGITLTKEAFISVVNAAKEVTLKNCMIRELSPYQAKSYIVTTKGDTPAKVVITGCYFGTNDAVSDNKYYNGLELVQKLADGSEISNNYFEANVCSNNIINIYDVEDGANIYIRNNVFEYSGNAVRVGTKGDAHCTINITNNTYNSTSEDIPEYAGLLLVQPYGNATTNMSNVNIVLSGNTHKDSLQLYYLYAGAGDMQFTDDNMPVITIK